MVVVDRHRGAAKQMRHYIHKLTIGSFDHGRRCISTITEGGVARV
jgi:hypothetical protein